METMDIDEVLEIILKKISPQIIKQLIQNKLVKEKYKLIHGQ